MAKTLSLSVIIALAICHGCAQGVPPAPPTVAATAAALPGSAQEFLDVHNQARADVGVDPLTWSPKLATAAGLKVRYQRDNQNCSYASLSGGEYGSNQMLSDGTAVTPRMAAENWVQQKSFYNYANNMCVAGHPRCRSYTQVVWKKSLELGCSQATCPKGQITLTICFYNPPGNTVGEKPY
ncbi:PREDICTED: STS14 protein-like [Ipomoea nil]|uniref:STS14 protein-like n=1 Tax=Ipomoea nil TaxID=35883 RepID=UPI000901E7D6|nr:PREDICTED: STS14 protein-like [Ipomoea nil]